MKNFSLLFFIPVFIAFSTFANGKEIISNAWMTDYISLGEEAEIDFDINYLTGCDSYSLDVEIDYLFKEIIVTVYYDYDEDCEETDDYDTEEVIIMPLLEGLYNVTIVCEVTSDISLDEKVYLGDLVVSPPENYNCDDSTIPYIYEFCPFSGEEVCACNGKNYDNECEAFFNEQHGIYYHFNCGDFVEENSIPFECGKFDLDVPNTFVIYDCSDFDEFEGDELYLEYEHNDTGTPLEIHFHSSSDDVKLFLVEINFGDLNCIAESEDTVLAVDNLSIGTYYIIADCDCWGYESIEICDITSTGGNLSGGDEILIFPGPVDSGFMVKSALYMKKITVRNSLGALVYSKNPNNKEITVDKKFVPGIYFVEIETGKGLIVKKIFISG